MKRILLCSSVGCAFAILANSALGQPVLNRVEQLLRRQLANPAAPVEQGYLGLVADDRLDAGRGLRVISIVPAGAAAAAGVQVNDLILEVDGRAMRSMDDMAQVITGKPPGTAIALTLERGGARQTLQVTLGRRAPAPVAGPVADPRAGADVRPGAEELPNPQFVPTPPPPRLGIRTIDISEEARQKNNLPLGSVGAVVLTVTPGSAAERAGIPIGAIIQAVDGRAVDSPQSLAATIRDSAAATGVELTYVFDGEQKRARVTFKAEPTVAARPPAIPPPTPGPFPGTAAPGASAEESPQRFERPHPALEALDARLRQIEARLEKLEVRFRGLQPADVAPEDAPKATSETAPDAKP